MNAVTDTTRINLERPDKEALALAQFVTRVTSSAMRECAVDEAECYEIRAAIDKVQRAGRCGICAAMSTNAARPVNNAAAVIDALAAGAFPIGCRS